MSRLQLSVAVGPYDRMMPLVLGEVQIDAVDPHFMLLEPEEIFFRAMRHEAFDICELSLSSYALRVARGDSPYVAVPVFPSRAFRHTCIVVRTDRGIRSPADLRGKRIGMPEYQLTANVWARAILEEEYGVHQRDIAWVRGGYETPGRIEKLSVALPEGVRVEDAPAGKTISGMLADGELDGVMGPRAPSCFERGDPMIRWLFEDPTTEAMAWYAKTRIFPVMHVLGIRRTLVERHPWLPGAVVKAFERSKRIALERLTDTSATKVTLPFVEENLRRARAMMGEDFFSYGLRPNRHVFEWFLRHHHAQGLSDRVLAPEELFHPSTLEAHKV
ncbi:PhnD/SsuA/transferrin family substrate-binding protein [Falsiroseomonas oryziterrae]|uniref:PhnD/SsuA/transferrin family substrate-binding protein n=1 Tax=Falsiroseomonas oryziterrae TaxID=2911368 RepID=UPI001F2FFE3D|nr:PhnD/SsuA/transferrin family substrate-binding protein [Roseomonas sp. NPKOSM-4]